MNKIYKVIWSKVKHQYVVVSELAHSSGKQSRTARKSLRSRIAALVVCGAIAAFGVFGVTEQQAFAADTVKQAEQTQYVAFKANTGSQDWRKGYKYFYDNGQRIKYNAQTLDLEDGSHIYYWVRDGYTLEVQENAPYIPEDLMKKDDIGVTPDYRINAVLTDPDKVNVPVLQTTQSFSTGTNITTTRGDSLEKVEVGYYAGVSNSEGVETNGTWNYIIDPNMQGNFDEFIDTNPTDKTNVWNSGYLKQVELRGDSYYLGDQKVDSKYVYVIDGKKGVFVTTQGGNEIYTGKVYGAHNEILMTGKDENGDYYSYWAAKSSDDNVSLADSDLTLKDYRDNIATQERNQKKLAAADIKSVKVDSTNNRIDLITNVQYDENGNPLKGTEGTIQGFTVTSVANKGEDTEIKFADNNDNGFTVNAGSRVVGKTDTGVANEGDTLTSVDINGKNYLLGGGKTYSDGAGIKFEGTDNPTISVDLAENSGLHFVNENGEQKLANNLSIDSETGVSDAHKDGGNWTITENDGKEINRTFTNTTLDKDASEAATEIIYGTGENNKKEVYGKNYVVVDTDGNTVNISDVASASKLEKVDGNVSQNTIDIDNLTTTVNNGWTATVGDTEINVKPDENGTAGKLNFTAGNNIALTADTKNNAITIAADGVVSYDETDDGYNKDSITLDSNTPYTNKSGGTHIYNVGYADDTLKDTDPNKYGSQAVNVDYLNDHAGDLITGNNNLKVHQDTAIGTDGGAKGNNGGNWYVTDKNQTSGEEEIKFTNTTLSSTVTSDKEITNDKNKEDEDFVSYGKDQIITDTDGNTATISDVASADKLKDIDINKIGNLQYNDITEGDSDKTSIVHNNDNVTVAIGKLDNSVTNLTSTVNEGWTAQAGEDKIPVNPTEVDGEKQNTLEFTGDENIDVTADTTDRAIKVALKDDINVNSVTAGTGTATTTINSAGLSTGTVKVNGGTTNTITGLSNTKWDEETIKAVNADEGRTGAAAVAATQGQLKDVADLASQAQTDAGKHTTIQNNGKNITIKENNTTDGHLDYTVDLNDNITLGEGDNQIQLNGAIASDDSETPVVNVGDKFKVYKNGNIQALAKPDGAGQLNQQFTLEAGGATFRAMDGDTAETSTKLTSTNINGGRIIARNDTQGMDQTMVDGGTITINKSGNTIKINGEENKATMTGLTNTTWENDEQWQAANVKADRAATEGQLQVLSDTLDTVNDFAVKYDKDNEDKVDYSNVTLGGETYTKTVDENGEATYEGGTALKNVAYAGNVVDENGEVIGSAAVNVDYLKDSAAGLIAENNNLKVAADNDGDRNLNNWTITDTNQTDAQGKPLTFSNTTLDVDNSTSTPIAVAIGKPEAEKYGQTFKIADTAGNVVTISDIASAKKLIEVDKTAQAAQTEAGKHTSVSVGDNLSVDTSTNGNGGTDYEITLNPDVTLKGDNSSIELTGTKGTIQVNQKTAEGTDFTNINGNIVSIGYTNSEGTQNAIVIDGGEGTITGLSNTTWDGTTDDESRAATEGQLQQAVSEVAEVANAGWTASDGTNSISIKPNETLNFVGDENLTVSADGTDKKLKVSLNDDITLGNPKAGNTEGERSFTINTTAPEGYVPDSYKEENSSGAEFIKENGGFMLFATDTQGYGVFGVTAKGSAWAKDFKTYTTDIYGNNTQYSLNDVGDAVAQMSSYYNKENGKSYTVFSRYLNEAEKDNPFATVDENATRDIPLALRDDGAVLIGATIKDDDFTDNGIRINAETETTYDGDGNEVTNNIATITGLENTTWTPPEPEQSQIATFADDTPKTSRAATEAQLDDLYSSVVGYNVENGKVNTSHVTLGGTKDYKSYESRDVNGTKTYSGGVTLDNVAYATGEDGSEAVNVDYLNNAIKDAVKDGPVASNEKHLDTSKTYTPDKTTGTITINEVDGTGAVTGNQLVINDVASKAELDSLKTGVGDRNYNNVTDTTPIANGDSVTTAIGKLNNSIKGVTQDVINNSISGGHVDETGKVVLEKGEGENKSEVTTDIQLTDSEVSGVTLEKDTETGKNVLTITSTDKYDKNKTSSVTVSGLEIASTDDIKDVTGVASSEDLKDAYKDADKDGNATTEYITDSESMVEADVALDHAIQDVAGTSYANDMVLSNRIDSVEKRLGNVEERIDKVGAMAAAIANLRTMGFDPEAPTEIAIGVGQYKSETGIAIGVFHYPNQDFMLSASLSSSGDELMGGIGATWKLGRKSAAERAKDEEARHLEQAEEMKKLAQQEKVKAQAQRHAKLLAERQQASQKNA